MKRDVYYQLKTTPVYKTGDKFYKSLSEQDRIIFDKYIEDRAKELFATMMYDKAAKSVIYVVIMLIAAIYGSLSTVLSPFPYNIFLVLSAVVWIVVYFIKFLLIQIDE